MARRLRPTRVHVLALAFLIAAGLLPAAHAHALDLFVSTDGSLIEGMAYFSDGGRPRGALAELVVDGEIVATTQTDTDGRFTFDLPSGSADVRVSVDVGDGHRASWQLRSDQLPRGPQPEPIGAADTTDAAAAPQPGADTYPERPASDAELATAIAEAVDERITQQLAGLREEFALDSRRRRVSDVLGGLGYILGLMGLATYLLRRKA